MIIREYDILPGDFVAIGKEPTMIKGMVVSISTEEKVVNRLDGTTSRDIFFWYFDDSSGSVEHQFVPSLVFSHLNLKLLHRPSKTHAK